METRMSTMHSKLTFRSENNEVREVAGNRATALLTPNRAFLIIVFAYCVYTAIYIYRTSFVVGGERYFTLADDAMISMRYAKNLVQGWGLVWNPGGQRVEGYTNPLWVFYMAAWHLLPIAASKISLFIQLTGAACILANLFFIRKIAHALSGGSATIAVLSVLFVGLYTPVTNWSLQGAEVGPLTLIVGIAAWKVIQILNTGQMSPTLYLLLGVATLIRIDMVVVLFACLSFLAIADPKNRRSHIFYGLASFLFFIGIQTVLRWSYYGELLPNTYNLKMEGFPLLQRLTRGLFVFGQFVVYMNPLLFLAPFALLWLRRDKVVLFLLWLFVSQVAYSVYVGGDAWEWWGGSNRYTSLVMPVFLVLLSYSLWTYASKLKTLLELRPLPALATRGIATSIVLFVTLCVNPIDSYLNLGLSLSLWALILVTGMLLSFVLERRMQMGQTPEALDSHPNESKVLRIERYYKPALVALLVLTLLNINIVHPPLVRVELDPLRPPIQREDNELRVVQARVLDRITSGSARVAVVWAGIIPYFADRYMIDLLGKNDKIIAHEEMRRTTGENPYIDFYPGHMKWDYPYTLGELKPDVVIQIFPGTLSLPDKASANIPPDALKYLSADYNYKYVGGVDLYVRKGSSSVLWDSLQCVECP